MTATTEQTTVPPGTLPTVIYDKEHLTITATVIVSSSPTDSSGLSVLAPVIAIPGPESGQPWQVLWQVVHDDSLGGASFNPTAPTPVQIPALGTSLPNRVKVGTPETGLLGNECQIPIDNGAQGPNSFRYFLFLQGNLPGVEQPMFKPHDPTIVVTPEPIGGTTS